MDNWKIKFATIWSGQALSFFTSAILQMALIWHLTIATGSALVLAIASIAGFLPMAVLGGFAGTLVDRWDRKRTMIVSDLFVAAVSLSLFVFSLFGEPPIAVFIAVIFIRAIGTTFHSPAISATTPLIVPETHLTKVAGYTQTVQTLGFIAGTSVAAILYPLIGVPGMVMMDVGGAVLASVSVAVVAIPKLQKAEPHEVGEQEAAEQEAGEQESAEQEAVQKPSLFSEAKEGYRVLKKNRGLFALLWTGMVFSFAFSSINALYPLMSMGYFGAGTTGAAVVEALFAGGMMLGGIVLGITGGFKNRAVSMFLATLICGVGILASGLLPPAAFVGWVVLSFVIGFSAPLYQGPQMALLQERIPPAFLGRVFGLIGSVSSLAMLAGLVAVGAFGDAIGVDNAFVVSGAIITLLAVVIISIPSVRYIDKGEKAIKNFQRG